MSPMRPFHPCNWPGCRALVRGTPRCPRHTREHWKQDTATRGSPTARGIDSKWRKLRNEVLAAEPFCRECARQGRQRPAAIVDHIQPHRGNEALRLSKLNCQPLCRSCHALKTAREGPGYVARR